MKNWIRRHLLSSFVAVLAMKALDGVELMWLRIGLMFVIVLVFLELQAWVKYEESEGG